MEKINEKMEIKIDNQKNDKANDELGNDIIVQLDRTNEILDIKSTFTIFYIFALLQIIMNIATLILK